jgi:hypothetical protein
MCSVGAGGCTVWGPPATCSVGSCLAGACTAIPVDNKLVAYYAFEEPGSTVVDRSGNGNDGTVWNAVQVAGKVGKGYRTGDGQCLLFPLTSSLGMVGGSAVTQMAWAMPSTGACLGDTNGVIYNKDFAYEMAIQCGMNVAEAALGTTSQSWVWDVTTTTVSLGAWHHVATTWDGATYVLYVDGASVASWPATGQFYQTSSGEGIGCYHVPQDGTPSASISGFFNGVIDEVAIYGRALSAAEIASYYAATK